MRGALRLSYDHTALVFSLCHFVILFCHALSYCSSIAVVLFPICRYSILPLGSGDSFSCLVLLIAFCNLAFLAFSVLINGTYTIP